MSNKKLSKTIITKCIACGSAEGTPILPEHLPPELRMRNLDDIHEHWWWQNIPEPYSYKIGPFCSEKCAVSDIPMSVILKCIFGDERKAEFLIYCYENEKIDSIDRSQDIEDSKKTRIEWEKSKILIPVPQAEDGIAWSPEAAAADNIIKFVALPESQTTQQD